MQEVSVTVDFPSVVNVPIRVPVEALREAQTDAMREQLRTMVDSVVEERVPSAELLIESFTMDWDFTRRVRDWMVESISYADLAHTMWNHVDRAEILDSLELTEERFAELIKAHLFSDRRLSRIIESQISSQITNSDYMDALASRMQTFIDQKVADIADLVMHRVVGNFAKALDE
jgi:hypothetical protein